jgi:hypothetical protein
VNFDARMRDARNARRGQSRGEGRGGRGGRGPEGVLCFLEKVSMTAGSPPDEERERGGEVFDMTNAETSGFGNTWDTSMALSSKSMGGVEVHISVWITDARGISSESDDDDKPFPAFSFWASSGTFCRIASK